MKEETCRKGNATNIYTYNGRVFE